MVLSGGRGRAALALVAVCAGALGCREQVFEPVRDGLVSTAVLEGEVNVTRKADLLFVIDDSPSMANEQQKLAQGFPELLARLEALDPPVDYRVAVMTTSVIERFGPCDPSSPDPAASCSANFGGTGFTCEAGACVRRFPSLAGRLVAAPGNPAVLDRTRLGAADLAARFAENVRVGVDGSRHEQPLRAVRKAIESGGLRELLRDDARLVVLIASDEDDCSDSRDRILAQEMTGPSTVIDHCEEQARTEGGVLDGLEEWTRWFHSLPAGGGRREVALGAITGLGTGTYEPGMCVDDGCASECRAPAKEQACKDGPCAGATVGSLCVSECIKECEKFCGSQVPGRRLARAVRALNGPLASICESSFGNALASLARVIGIPERIDLPSAPSDPRAFYFRVERSGRVIECRAGADYVLDGAATPPAMDIVQGGACRLMPGDRWSIRYLAK